jgi:carbon-monoxide dehydrogenase medium subunit
MHRVLRPFDFVEATSIREAAELVDGDQSRILAGGVDLVLKMRRREIQPETVISIQKVPGLDQVEANGNGGLKFGAMATLRQIEQSPVVIENCPLLREAIGNIVSVQTKVMGTVIGNLCVGTPASDVAPVLCVLGGMVKIAGAGSEREIPVDDFFVDVGRTALKPHEMVTEISVPGLPPGSVGAFVKLSRTAEDIAKVNVAVMLKMTGKKCAEAGIALGSVAPIPLRARGAEEVLKGEAMDRKTIEAASRAASEAVKPISDVRSTAAYRKEMVKVLVKDALEKAAGRYQA